MAECETQDSGITATERDDGNRILLTTWTDGEVRRFPYVWLRDNCPCGTCYEPTSSARRHLALHVDPNIVPDSVKVTDNGKLSITWPDGHESEFGIQWLDTRSFTKEAAEKRRWYYSPEPVTWGREMQEKIPFDTFENILNDDRALFNWINTLEETGLFLLKGTPGGMGQMEKIGKRVGMLRATHYGKETIQVKVTANPHSRAYTAETLDLHTDLPYFRNQLYIQMLRCIIQTKTDGGANQFTDGFRAVAQLKDAYPEYHRLLSEYPVYFKDIGSDVYEYHKLKALPMIVYDRHGKLDSINQSQSMRDSYMNHLPVEVVQPYYCAMRAFHQLLRHPDNMITYKMEEGDIACFNNCRLVHGRTGYDLATGGQRHLEVAYLDWDTMMSTRRVMMKRLDL